MTPFVQELVSFISILTGVIVLTSWVMWILLRPDGDSKAKDFAQESAKDGLTRCVMENNELKNAIQQLESEKKVLMSAGYGKKTESRNEEHEVREERNTRESLKGKGGRVEAEDKGQKIKLESTGENSVTQKSLATTKQAATEKESQIEEQAGLLDEDTIEIKADLEETLDENSEPVLQQTNDEIKDETEQDKIAAYMANVEKESQRHKNEVEKVKAWKESGPHADDDLKKIRGIGPHIENLLKKEGVTSYQQIADFSEEDIRLVAQAIGTFPKSIKRDQWVKQAKALLTKQ